MLSFGDVQTFIFQHHAERIRGLVDAWSAVVAGGGRVFLVGTPATEPLAGYLVRQLEAAGLSVCLLPRLDAGVPAERAAGREIPPAFHFPLSTSNPSEAFPVEGDTILALAGTERDPLLRGAVRTWRGRGIPAFVLAAGAAEFGGHAMDLHLPTVDADLFAHAAILVGGYLRRRLAGRGPEARCRYLIKFYCWQCSELILVDAVDAGGEAICPLCDAGLRLPDGPVRPFLVGQAAFPDTERRVALRFALGDCAVRFSAGTDSDVDQVPVSGRLADLSQRGMAFSAPGAPVRKGERLRMRVDVPAFLDPLYLEGEVKRLEAEGRVGVEFVDCPPRTMEKLQRLEALAVVGALN